MIAPEHAPRPAPRTRRPPLPDTCPSWEEPYRPDPLDLLGDATLPMDLLPVLKDYVEQRRKRNQDTYIAVTGREGDGKSALGLTAALALDPDLNPEDVILDHADYARVYDPDSRDQVYVFDEAGRLFFNRRWQSKRQVALIQEVMENRQNRNVVFLHLPQFKVLDKYVREGRVPLWFACRRQGVAMIRKLRYNAWSEEAYYPVVVDEHYWDPLEISHPAFARSYYARKQGAHSRAFKKRAGQVREQREEEQTDLDFKEARRQAVLEMRDS